VQFFTLKKKKTNSRLQGSSNLDHKRLFGKQRTRGRAGTHTKKTRRY
jgi:hypothetical protein